MKKKKLKQTENYEVIKLEKLVEKLNDEDGKIVLVGDAGINYREKNCENCQK